ncbi:MAG TPA: helix-turn-helix transcriptional regulator [Candidatus Saccharimonadales bacterium]|nr:helix-turn-helix transcriptional regulator [Candidatus Saccharimonadales bacterium]
MPFSKEQQEDTEQLIDKYSGQWGRIPWELRKLRRSKGVSQKLLATKLDCTVSRISHFENQDDIANGYGFMLAYAAAIDAEVIVVDRSSPPPLGIPN